MILTWDELARERGRLTLVDGSFDPLHVGHLKYFHTARSFGPPLCVNICPDGYTATKHPILLPAAERAQILNSLALVSYVHISERPTVEVLHQLQPKTYVKGDDWRDRLPADQIAACSQHGTTIAYTKTVQQSSTQLLAQFQPDVDAFERLVLSQQPAEKPWEPVTPFDFESRRAVEGEHPQLIYRWLIPCDDADVLDYGCGPGHLVHLLREQRAPNSQVCFFGYDPADRWHEGWRVHSAELDRRGCVWDLVICREVGEHCTMRELVALVKRICGLSANLVYMTMRLNLSPRHILDVQTSDRLDPTHITLPPKDLVRVLFALEGFQRRADLEDKLDHQRQGRCLVYERA